MSFNGHVNKTQPFRVYCVCGGIGFPFGTASTKRIQLIGYCLLSSGLQFHVWHIGPSPFRENVFIDGEFGGITYEYLSPSMSRPKNSLRRIFFYFWGCVLLGLRLFKYRKHCVVYVYYQGNIINLWALWLCSLMRIPVVQEACEWWAGTAYSTFFTRWMYSHIMFRLSNGAMPISHEIEKRIRYLVGFKYSVCRVPVLIDSMENEHLKKNINDNFESPLLLWCGMVDGYKRDVLFLIDAMAELRSEVGKNSVLRIVGPCTKKTRSELYAHARSKNIATQRLDIVGFVNEVQLWNYCSQANALLLPLWDDDRSCTRFPTKLGQYVAVGRPIVTVHTGELKHFLSDETAVFYEAGNACNLAHALDRLLNDSDWGERIALNATREVLEKVDFRYNALRISDWFREIYFGDIKA